MASKASYPEARPCRLDLCGYDGEPFVALLLMSRREEFGNLLSKDSEQMKTNITAIRSFVKAWNRGEKDVTGRSPIRECRPLFWLLITDFQIIQKEKVHITAQVATENMWPRGGPYTTRGPIHITAKNYSIQHNYLSYVIKDPGTTWPYELESGMILKVRDALGDSQNMTTEKMKKWMIDEVFPGFAHKEWNPRPGNGLPSASMPPAVGKLKADGTPCYWCDDTRTFFILERKMVRPSEINLSPKQTSAVQPPRPEQGRKGR